jgi:ankyrin repeat protein
MENIMLNLKQSLIKKTFFMIILICGLSSGLQAVDWSSWNPRTLATNLYQRLFSQRSEMSGQLREVASIMREQQQRNQTLREKLERIATKSGDQNQLWNDIFHLIDAGADVNTATKREIEEYGQTKIVDDLTALHLAATDRPHMIEFLISKGADQNKKNADGYTYKDIIKASKKISELKESQQTTQPQTSAESKLKVTLNDIYNGKNTEQNWEMIRDIISRNRNLINTEISNYWTALHVAANVGNIRMVNFLIGYGANPQLRNSDGMNAFDLAANIIDKGTKEDILKLLSKEFSSAQFGSPKDAHKSITQIFQETHHRFPQRLQTLTPSEQLEQKIGGLVKEFIPRSPQKRLLEEEEEEEDVPEVSSLPVYY